MSECVVRSGVTGENEEQEKQNATLAALARAGVIRLLAQSLCECVCMCTVVYVVLCECVYTYMAEHYLCAFFLSWVWLICVLVPAVIYMCMCVCVCVCTC